MKSQSGLRKTQPIVIGKLGVNSCSFLQLWMRCGRYLAVRFR